MNWATAVLRRFGLFWWDFIVGDDWLIAAGIVVVLGVTGALAHRGITAWWLLPLAIPTLLLWSLRRATVAMSSEA